MGTVVLVIIATVADMVAMVEMDTVARMTHMAEEHTVPEAQQIPLTHKLVCKLISHTRPHHHQQVRIIKNKFLVYLQ